MTTWGIVSTIKAPLRDVLNFAAWHLEQGAHRLFIYLDAPDDQCFQILKEHPHIRPVQTGDAYWAKHGGRPKKHQVRQVRNATRTYRRRADVDWLAHIDVDEFLIPEGSVADQLTNLPTDCHVARMRPMEALASPTSEILLNFKTLTLDRKARRAQAAEVWPTFGTYLNGGFLSHVAGKIFVRTGLEDGTFKIHNFYQAEDENPGQLEMPHIALAHLHAENWNEWLKHYRYRLTDGSYRSELKPNSPKESGGLSLHQLLSMIEQEGGEPALRLFFDEVCAATPGHLDRLNRNGLLRQEELPLDDVRAKHFGHIALSE